MFKQFTNNEGNVAYRPTAQMQANLEHDGIAFCSGCTQFHEGVDANAMRLFCVDCEQHSVFGYLQLSQI